MRIGEVAELTGTTPRTIRYYEEIGLLSGGTEREIGKHRCYSQADVDRIKEIVRLKDLLGLSLEQLSQLLEAETARADIRREFQETDDPERQRELLLKSRGHIDEPARAGAGPHRRALEARGRPQRACRARPRPAERALLVSSTSRSGAAPHRMLGSERVAQQHFRSRRTWQIGRAVSFRRGRSVRAVGFNVVALRSVRTYLGSLGLREACTMVATVSLALAGAVAGLIRGLEVHPQTAVFAMFELGAPAAIVGVALGSADRNDRSRGQKPSGSSSLSPLRTGMLGANAAVGDQSSIPAVSGLVPGSGRNVSVGRPPAGAHSGA